MRTLTARLLVFAVLASLLLSLRWAYRDPVIWIRLQDGQFPLSIDEQTRHQLSACAQVPNDELVELQQANKLSVQTYIGSYRLRDGNHVDKSTPLCVLVAAPQYAPHHRELRYGPVAGLGPDDIRLLVNSSTVKLTFPPLKPLPGQVSLTKILANDAVLYFAEPTLTDPGDYEIHVWREWSNWAWSKIFTKTPDAQRVIYNTQFTEKIQDSPLANETLMSQNKVSHRNKRPDPEIASLERIQPASFRVNGHSNFHEKPLCGPRVSAAKGRWYDVATFDIDSRFKDEWGFAWSGDDCRLDYFTEADAFNCLENKTIHVHGDSNARRLSKTIITAGRWCHNATAPCQVTDHRQPLEKLLFNKTTNRLEQVSQPSFAFTHSRAIRFGKNSRLYFTFLGSLSLMQASWMNLFYDFPNGTAPTSEFASAASLLQLNQTFMDSPLTGFNATPRPPPNLPKADLAVVAVGAWDEALDQSFEEYEVVLPAFRDAFMAAYKRTIKVLRLSQGYCCRREFSDYSWRRFTGARIDHMTRIVRKIFRVNGSKAMRGQVQVLDPSGFAGRPEVVTDYIQETSNHERASHIRLEYQMLLNSICIKDSKTKRARLRENLKT